MVLGLSHHTPLHHSMAFTKEVPSSMNIGAGDPTRPIPPNLDVIDKNESLLVYKFLLLFFNLFFLFILFVSWREVSLDRDKESFEVLFRQVRYIEAPTPVYHLVFEPVSALDYYYR